MTTQHYHAAKLIIISHTTKLFPIFFISNQKSAISHHSPPLCAPAPSAHKQSHIVRKTIATLLRKTIAILLRQILTSNPLWGEFSCQREQSIKLA